MILILLLLKINKRSKKRDILQWIDELLANCEGKKQSPPLII